MALDYSERAIWSVEVRGLSLGHAADGEGVGTAVTIYLTREGDMNLPRPNIDIHFAFPASHELSIRELEREALASASALLARFAQETPASLADAAQKWREKPRAIDQG